MNKSNNKIRPHRKKNVTLTITNCNKCPFNKWDGCQRTCTYDPNNVFETS